MAKLVFQPCNFQGKSGMVPWVAITEGKMPGLKKSQVGDKWYPAMSPETVLAILEADNISEIIAVCNAAIKSATPAPVVPPAPVKVVAPPPPAPVAGAMYYCFDGESVMVSENGAITLTAPEVLQVYAGNPVTRFCLVDTVEWKTPAELGIFAAPVPPPPPARVAPVAPPAPPAPVAAAPVVSASTDVKGILERIAANRKK